MMSKQICILGGSGFLGRYLIESLTRKNFLVRVATRHRERNRHLLVNPNVSLIEADIHNEEALHSLFSGCEVVINLVGILNGSQEQLRKTHIELPQKIVSVCNRIGVKRLLHMSALQAGSANAMSQYLRSKGEGENIAHHQSSHHLNVTSFRPSTIFGEGDHLFNRFASMLRLPLLAVPLACPEARFSPIYAQDVAEAMIQSIRNPATYGKRYDLCGPQSYSLMELMEFTERCIGVRRLIVGLSNSLSSLQAKILQRLPGKLLTQDNYLTLQLPSTCQKPLNPVFNIELSHMESVVPHYLGQKSQQMRYMAYRKLAKRD